MNQASLLVFGLLTLTWGNAAMAKEVSFDASAIPSYTPAIPQFDAPLPDTQPVEQLSPPSEHGLSVLQAKATDSAITKAAPSQTNDAIEGSPFQLPQHLTDADLFEPALEVTSKNESFPPVTPVISNAPSPSPGIEFEQTPDAEFSAAPIAAIPIAAVPSATSSNSAPISPPASKPIGLDFSLPPANVASDAPGVAVTPSVEPSPIPEHADSNSNPSLDHASLDHASLDTLFAGDSNSLVAKAVGSAEGTRTPDGGKNPAYYGHTDPGNGVWNLGSFSYQHGASSPEEADTKQLARLRTQAETMLGKAKTQGVDLTLEEKLNGIDLANQAPKAVLDSQGYIDWLAEAHRQGMKGSNAILWARVQSFIDPYTQTWNAPGLGNTEAQITHDQERRMLAIARALTAYLQDLANNSPQPSKNQVSQHSLTEEQGIARLFIQPMTQLFKGSSAASSEQRESDTRGIQQLLSLDL